MAARHRILPHRGTLLVGTDLHGNLQDLEQLRGLFLDRHSRDGETHLALLGDLVHGPDPRAREQWPDLHDFDDQSWEVAHGVIELRRTFSDRVHLVLGNHDHGHVGGPHPGKFYPDEVEHLESTLSAAQRAELRGLFEDALLMLIAPCGVVLTHGSPDDTLDDPTRLDRLSLVPGENSPADARVLESLLTSYGQQAEVTERLLDALSRRTGLSLSMVVHGHDRDEAGYFTEGGNQVCPVIFGAPPEAKRYLCLDLAARYHGPDDLREGIEVRRLFDPDV